MVNRTKEFTASFGPSIVHATKEVSRPNEFFEVPSKNFLTSDNITLFYTIFVAKIQETRTLLALNNMTKKH